MKTKLLTLLVLAASVTIVWAALNLNQDKSLNYKVADKEKSQDLNPRNNHESKDLTNLNEVESKSEQKENEKPSKLMLRFLDVATGYSVVPDRVEVYHRDDSDLNQIVVNEQIADNGTIQLHLENGIYDVTVIVEGYGTMTSFFELFDRSLNVNFNLEPEVQLKELTTEFIQSLHKESAMILLGYIVDHRTGDPIGDVKVFSKDESASTLSREDGYFQLTLFLPEKKDLIEKRGIVLFEKNGYTTELRKNFDMWPKGDIVLRIRMSEGEGINKEKVIKTRDAIIVTSIQNDN